MKALKLAMVVRLCYMLPLGATGFARAHPGNESTLDAARKARDRADVEALRTAVESVQSQASQAGAFQTYLRTAQLEQWLCEAAHAHQDDKLVKKSAEAGISAAEKAVQLSPDSSEAHRLLGDLLGELIPHVLAGGPRYGPRSTKEAEKAIELDPKNPNAFVARATNYFFAPAAFGGSKEKAIEMLKKAIELDPSSDTAHIRLAQVYLAQGQREDAVREINVARQLNPERVFTQHVYKQLGSGTNK